jgi:hypothetical protein
VTAKPGLEDRVAPDAREEEHVAEEECVEAEREDEQPGIGDREGADAKQAELEHGRRMPARAPDKGGQEHGGGRERADHPGGAPAPLRPLDDAERKRADPDSEQDDADRIREQGLRVAALAEDAPRGDEHGQPDRQVDEEHRPPALPLDEHAAERGAGGGRDRPGRAPERGRGRPLLERELGEDQPERRRHEQRCAQRLDRPAGDQQFDRVGHSAKHRGAEEDEDAEEEEPAPAEAVGQPPRRDERRREHDRVGVEDPGELRDRRRRERRADVWERDVDDCHVEEAHEHPHRRDQQHLPTARQETTLSGNRGGLRNGFALGRILCRRRLEKAYVFSRCGGP